VSFDAAAAKALFQALESHALTLGIFDRVNTHVPASVPGKGLSCSISLGSVAATPEASGLAAVSGTITFNVMIFNPMTQRSLDGIDQGTLTAVCTLLAEYSGNFTLGGTVRDIDLLALKAEPAYLEQENKHFRVEQISVAVVINDLWGMSP
jgi:hypothetical protein